MSGAREEIAAGGIAFKVDLLWKVIVIGGLAFAGRASWKAWEDSQETLMRLIEVQSEHAVRLAVIETILNRLGIPAPRDGG